VLDGDTVALKDGRTVDLRGVQVPDCYATQARTKLRRLLPVKAKARAQGERGNRAATCSAGVAARRGRGGAAWAWRRGVGAVARRGRGGAVWAWRRSLGVAVWRGWGAWRGGSRAGC